MQHMSHPWSCHIVGTMFRPVHCQGTGLLLHAQAWKGGHAPWEPGAQVWELYDFALEGDSLPNTFQGSGKLPQSIWYGTVLYMSAHPCKLQGPSPGPSRFASQPIQPLPWSTSRLPGLLPWSLSG
jgi:hypothetical protein